MPMSVQYNAHVVTLSPRIEEIVLFLIMHQEMICKTPLCALEFHCGHGRDVKGKLKVELPKPKIMLDTR